MLKILAWIIATLLSSVLYRMGGAQGFNTKFRDLGLPTIAVALLTYLGGWHWIYILCFGLYFGSLTTYWKKKGTDAKWFNWLLTGLGYSLSFLPLALFTGHWLGFCIRTILVSVGVTIWSEKIGNAVVEELGRGVITTSTLPLLLI